MTPTETLDRLPENLRNHRAANSLTYRQAATATGLAPATLHRLEHGQAVTLPTARTVLLWLETSR